MKVDFFKKSLKLYFFLPAALAFIFYACVNTRKSSKEKRQEFFLQQEDSFEEVENSISKREALNDLRETNTQKYNAVIKTLSSSPGEYMKDRIIIVNLDDSHAQLKFGIELKSMNVVNLNLSEDFTYLFLDPYKSVAFTIITQSPPKKYKIRRNNIYCIKRISHNSLGLWRVD